MKKHCSWRILRCDAQVNLTFYFSIETYFINKISLKKKKSQVHDPCTQKVYSDTLKLNTKSTSIMQSKGKNKNKKH